jgi:hypothetical protein
MDNYKINFIIFKLARTGSTNLVNSLNRLPEVTCFMENFKFFNKSKHHTYKNFLEKKFLRKTNNITGFSINPLKRINFADIDFELPKGNNFIFSLTRSPFDQTISKIISKNANIFPADRRDVKAKNYFQALSDGIRLDETVFEKELNKSKKTNKQIVQIARDYAHSKNYNYFSISYENIYINNKDLKILESCLGINLDSKDFDIKNKLIKDDISKKIVNYRELTKFL